MEGVNPNMRWSRDVTSHTPLTCAVEMVRPDIIKLLLSHPATNPNLNGLDGFTPLTLAVTKGSKEMVSVLLASPSCDCRLLYLGVPLVQGRISGAKFLCKFISGFMFCV